MRGERESLEKEMAAQEEQLDRLVNMQEVDVIF